MPPLVRTPGQRSLISGKGVDERLGVAVVLGDAGGDGQDVRVEDDVFGGPAAALGQQVVSPGADRYLPFGGVGLALLVEGHDHHAGAVAPDHVGMLQEGFLSLLEADRVDDAPALHALQPGLKNAPPRAVDHHRDPGRLGLRRDQVQERGHRLLAVEQVRVHVHVEQVGAVAHLVEGDVHGGLVVLGLDEPAEPGRAGDVGPLADHHEPGIAGDRERLQPGQPRHPAGPRGRGTPRAGPDRGGDLGDVRGRGATAAPDDVHHALGRELVQVVRCFLRLLVVAAEGVGQSRVRMAGRVGVREPAELGDVRPDLLAAE